MGNATYASFCWLGKIAGRLTPAPTAKDGLFIPWSLPATPPALKRRM